MIFVSLTSTTRPTNTRLASAKLGSRSKLRNHSSCAEESIAPIRLIAIRSILQPCGCQEELLLWPIRNFSFLRDNLGVSNPPTHPCVITSQPTERQVTHGA